MFSISDLEVSAVAVGIASSWSDSIPSVVGSVLPVVALFYGVFWAFRMLREEFGRGSPSDAFGNDSRDPWFCHECGREKPYRPYTCPHSDPVLFPDSDLSE